MNVIFVPMRKNLGGLSLLSLILINNYCHDITTVLYLFVIQSLRHMLNVEF